MVGSWTLEIGGTVRKYNSFSFDRNLEKKVPTKFSGRVEYDSNNLINYFDLIEAKRDGITEWKGFVETLEIEWTEDGRYYNVDGRDTTVILWKKWSDDFTSMHEGTEGFFGKVSVGELIKFLLRTPKSDSVHDYPANKEGWGLAPNRITDVFAGRTAYGDADWTTLRRRGIGWFNDGTPFASVNLNADQREFIDGWAVVGVWNTALQAENDGQYIHSFTPDAIADYSFPDLAANATALNSVSITVVWRPLQTWSPHQTAFCEIYMSFDKGATWEYIGDFGGRENAHPWASNPWRRFVFNITDKVDSVEDLRNENVWVRFKNKSSNLVTYIDHCYLSVSYVEVGTQAINDYFQIDFAPENIVGIYVESRFDNDSYPRNYEIVTATEVIQDLEIDGAEDWHETDPNGHIADDGASPSYHIDFLMLQNEDAWHYKDYLVGYFDTFFHHRIRCRPRGYIPHSAGAFGEGYYGVFYGLTNTLDDYFYLRNNPVQHLVLGISDIIRYNQGTVVACPANSDCGEVLIAFQVAEMHAENVAVNGLYDYGEYIYNDADASGTITAGDWRLTHVVAGGVTYLAGTQVQAGDNDIGAWALVPFIIAETHRENRNVDGAYNVGELIYFDLDASGTVSAGDIRMMPVGEGYPKFFVGERGLGGAGSSESYMGGVFGNGRLTENDTYLFDIERIGNYVHVYVFNESTPADNTELIHDGGKYEGVNCFQHWSRTFNASVSLRYATTAMTYNNGVHQPVDVDITDLYMDSYTILVPATVNTHRDIVHSWTPQTIDNIRIRILSPDTTHGWKISQAYVYKAEECDYRVWNESGCSPSFPLEQYIRAMNIVGYSESIGPINLKRARLIDVLNTVIEKMHTSYIPYRWWLTFDTNNTFHVASRKGSNISGSISFALGTHIESSDKKGEIDETVQRCKVVGRGESKRQEKVSSDWIVDTAAMNNVNTFFEELIVEKSIAESEVAKLVGNIFLEESADPLEKITVNVSNDVYASMNYDVGDDVLINDALIGEITQVKRIYYITKKIDADGEHVTLYLGAPYKTIETEWGEIYRRLKDLEIVGTITGDWSNFGVEKEKIDAKELSTFWEKKATNDELKTGDDKTDPKWILVGDGVNNAAFHLRDDKMALYGPDAFVGSHTLEVEMARDVPIETDYNVIGNLDRYNLRVRDDPKMVFELKCYRKEGVNPFDWNPNLDGEPDTLDIGFRQHLNDSRGVPPILVHTATGEGFWFKIIKGSGTTFNVWACWQERGDAAVTMRRMMDIEVNHKYRFEIIVDSERNWAIFNIYNIEEEGDIYPISVVATKVDEDTTFSPLWMRLVADDENNINLRAIAYIYRMTIESKRVRD